MNDMPRSFMGASVGSTELLTSLSAKRFLESGGAENVSIKARMSGKMWAYFEHFGRGHVWGIRVGAIERNFVRDVATELRPANSKAA